MEQQMVDSADDKKIHPRAEIAIDHVRVGRARHDVVHLLPHELQHGEVHGPVGDGQDELRARPARQVPGVLPLREGPDRQGGLPGGSPRGLQDRLHRVGGVHDGLGRAATYGTTDHGLPEVQAAVGGHR